MNQQQHDGFGQQPQQPQTRLLQRWNWKLGRLLQNILLLVVGIWALWLVVPAVISFVRGPDFLPIILQILLLTGYLILFISFQIFFIYFFLARTRVHWIRPGSAGVRFAHYQGNPEALAAAAYVVRLLRGAKTHQHEGGKLLRGLLLVGPPGAGKRYLAQAIATEAGVPIGYINLSSLLMSRMGLGPLKVAMVYRRARKLAREYGACILLADDITILTGLPREAPTADGLRPELQELLLQIDPPFQTRGWLRRLMGWLSLQTRREAASVLTIATTSQPLPLDSALLRPGRFDRQIRIPLPDAAGRRAIIHSYLGSVPHEPQVIERLVADTADYVPGAIKHVIGEALLHARLQGRQHVSYQDCVQACQAHIWGLPRTVLPASYAERRRTAYAQAGQIYVRHILAGPAYTSSIPAATDAASDEDILAALLHDKRSRSKDELLLDMQIALAGRAAEEVLIGMQTSGIAQDVRHATALALLMAGAFGMDRQLFSCLVGGKAWLQYAMQNSELRMRAEVILQEQFRHVRSLIVYNRPAITMLAEALILQEDASKRDTETLLAQVEQCHPFIDPTTQARPGASLVARRAPPRAALVPANNGRDFSEPDPPLPDDMRYSPAEPASSEPPPEASSEHSAPAAEDAATEEAALAEQAQTAEAAEQQREEPAAQAAEPEHPQTADDTDGPPRP